MAANRSPRMQSAVWLRSHGSYRFRRRWIPLLALTVLAAPVALSSAALGQTQPKTDAGSARPEEVQRITVLLAREQMEKPLPLSLLDFPPEDQGIAGAKLAIADNNTTG